MTRSLAACRLCAGLSDGPSRRIDAPAGWRFLAARLWRTALQTVWEHLQDGVDRTSRPGDHGSCLGPAPRVARPAGRCAGSFRRHSRRSDRRGHRPAAAEGSAAITSPGTSLRRKPGAFWKSRWPGCRGSPGPCAEVLAEHPGLLAELDGLLDRLAARDIGTEAWRQAGRDFEVFASHLLAHERNENAVVQEGYNEDLGLAD